MLIKQSELQKFIKVKIIFLKLREKQSNYFHHISNFSHDFLTKTVYWICILQFRQPTHFPNRNHLRAYILGYIFQNIELLDNRNPIFSCRLSYGEYPIDIFLRRGKIVPVIFHNRQSSNMGPPNPLTEQTPISLIILPPLSRISSSWRLIKCTGNRRWHFTSIKRR